LRNAALKTPTWGLSCLIMPEFIPVLTRADIERSVSEIAERISSDYQDKELVLIGALKGAFVFLSDLVRHLAIDVRIDFVGTASYGAQTSSSGKIRLTKEIDIDITDKHVLIVEDIVDTGLTLAFLIEYVKSFNPRSVKVCALIDKRERRDIDIDVAYAGHVVPEGFLVGYGLDYNERYRNLPGLYHMKL
jgi:hypoxanthine phosphoribosyltransferase